ncbi:kynureninase [Pseudidiomarina taiwanensis]|uniref:Kynureninase n=1 Tax=Pseudidiomarina taiwanensis TaxID=337250 RepID=A0A432ZMU8_9GAMM|nr:kynureninase [Pseudidiomarina taiwanensis]RUO79213.1 kynureninase [Pseudidiomarina taiwanensis]
MSLRQRAKELDAADPLAHLRTQFAIPAGKVYLDGNSLGPLAHPVRERMQQVLAEQWGEDLIESWNKHSWIDLPQRSAARLAHLLGTQADQVLCCDSISVNLFKVLTSALELQHRTEPTRNVVLSTQDNFPTDLYMVQGVSEFLGQHACQLQLVEEEQLLASLSEEIAVVLVTEVNFRSGRRLDIEKLCQHAHQLGILVIVDLAHSAGSVAVELERWQVDFAVGCTYKYLNGGPGAPAFLYCAKRHLEQNLKQPLQGWMGHAEPFAFTPDYVPAEGIQRFLSGTPSILAMTAVDAALDLFAGVDMQQLHQKALAVADFFAEALENSRWATEFTRLTPTQHSERGSQLSYSHPHAYAICQALIARGVIADFRAPSYLRLGFTPLYLGFEDIVNAFEALDQVLSNAEHLDPKWQKLQGKVT